MILTIAALIALAFISCDRDAPTRNKAGKATGDDCALCDLLSAFNEEEEEDKTPVEEAETDSTSSEGGPDLIVQSPSVSDSILTPEQAFTLHIAVHNQGDELAAATVLRYYRSNNATISASDTQVGTGAVDTLDASAISEQSIELTASVGVEQYYGACVESVRGESNTENNCSAAVKITISGQAAETDRSSEGGPDLIVQSASVSDSILTPEQAFTLHATVHNQGDAPAAATILHYYRSNNATISASDTQVGTGAVDALDTSATRADSIALAAPTGEGSGFYFYGACVASVRGESNTENNCSSAVKITVSGPGETEEDEEDVPEEADEPAKGSAASDRAVLSTFYVEMSGILWDKPYNWKSGASLSEWYGVTTDANGRVTKLELADNQVLGYLPDELGELEKLEVLDLSGNLLIGVIPPELGNLTNLKVLDFNSNLLEGPIPPELGNLTNLEVLNLEWNLLEGRFPQELGNLKNLQVLRVAGFIFGGMSGCIPASLRAVPDNDLRWLNLPNCSGSAKIVAGGQRRPGEAEARQALLIKQARVRELMPLLQ